MKMLRAAVLWAGLMVMAACAPMTIKGDPAREAQADRVLALTIAGDDEAVYAGMSPGLDKATTLGQLAVVRANLPKTPPPPGKTLGVFRMTSDAGDQYVLTRQYDFPTVTLFAQTQMIKVADGRWVVARFDFNKATPEQLKANDFSLTGKSPLHYGMLAAMVAVVGFIVTTVGVALYRRRWGWAFLCLFGFVCFQLNWATGAWGVQPIYFNLLGASFVRAASPLAPWVLSVSFPLGAALFWGMRKYRPKPPKAPKTKKGKAKREPFVSTPDDFSPIPQADSGASKEP